jgi:hypothetical protein
MNGGNISKRAALWDGPYEAVHGTAANIHIKLSTSNFKLKKGLVARATRPFFTAHYLRIRYRVV